MEFYGELWDEPFQWVLECLAEEPVADTISSLAFSGPDEGANGTREWEFTSLLDTQVSFPILRSLSIRPTEPQDHNISLIQRSGTNMEEGGEVARFVQKAPYLSELIVPNAPDSTFFQVELPHLSALHVGGGSDTQRFIENLAKSTNLPRLTVLDFTESTELQFTWSNERHEGVITSFASYERLLRSAACDPLRGLYLRNTCLTLEQLQSLQAIRPNLQLMVIQATQGGYVNHFSKGIFPWHHLVQSDPGQLP